MITEEHISEATRTRLHSSAGPDGIPMCVEWNHTQVKGQPHWKKAGASQKRAGPPGQRALEERDEVFIVLFDYSGKVMRR